MIAVVKNRDAAKVLPAALSKVYLGTAVVVWHSGIPSILSEHGYLSAELKEKWVQMIGFRNILVHEYLDIDRRIV